MDDRISLRTGGVMRITLYCVSIFLIITAAQAANLRPAASALLINQGNGFKPFTDSMVVRAGDRVMTSAGERAEIVYGDASCKLTIPAWSGRNRTSVREDGACTTGEAGWVFAQGRS